MGALLLVLALFLIAPPEYVNGAPFFVEFRATTNPRQLKQRGITGRTLQKNVGNGLCQLRGGENAISSPESTEEINVSKQNTSREFLFTLNQPGDGHEEEPYIPRRFVRMQKGNLEKAEVAYNATLAWRESHGVDSILSKPHPVYDIFKEVLPHFFSGRDINGNIIFCQQPGLLRMELLQLNNVTQQEFLMHYVYTLEYCWNMLEPRPDQTMTSILDGKGLSLSTVKKLFSFLNEFVSMMSHHYPQRSYKTLIINAPSWAGTIYKLISPLLRESTRSKISILNGGKRQDEVLKEVLGDVPSELSSTGTYKGMESVCEQEMRAFVMERLQEAGMEMKEVNQV
jgi:hypothetical protein